MKEIKKVLNEYNIYEIDHKNVSERDMNDIFELALERWEESYSMLPKPTFENEKYDYSHNHPSDLVSKFIIRNSEGELAGTTTISRIKPEVEAPESEKTRSWASISVRKKYRRLGIGSEILKFFTEYVSEKNIKKLQIFTSMDEGMKFCKKFGGEITGKSYYNYLDMKNLKMEGFKETACIIQGKNSEISVDTSIDLKDEDRKGYLKLLCEFGEDISQYSPEWDYDEKFFLKMTHEEEQILKKKGVVRLLSFARRKDGEIIGMSELHYNPKKPKEVFTEITGVTKKFRKKGLAKLLKINLFLFAKGKYPELEILLTENDEGNSSMRKINHEFGFQSMPIQTEYTFKIEKLSKKFEI